MLQFEPQFNQNSAAYLGIYAKSSPLQQWRGFQPDSANVKKTNSAAFLAPEIEPKSEKRKAQFSPASVRLERFALQSAARCLLPKSRIANCLRLRQFGKTAVEVWHSIEHGTFQYAALQTCASVWACPVCAAKISERRRLELLQAMEQHKANGGQVLLLTLTNPHTATDDLQVMLKAQALAMSRFNSTKSAKALWSSIDCIGSVRAWEVTHGANGWHPHFHLLLFVRPGLELESLRLRFYSVWANCCRLAKLPIPSEQHGVRLDDGSKAAEYVSKGLWGLDREMTKGHMKKAKSEKGRSPFDLLRSYMYDNDKQAGALFREYSAAFKGKRQLVWSKGLKALFAVEEKTDEETAAAIEARSVLFGYIELEDWKLILKAELRGEVLELARLGWDLVEALIVSLRNAQQDTS